METRQRSGRQARHYTRGNGRMDPTRERGIPLVRAAGRVRKIENHQVRCILHYFVFFPRAFKFINQ